MREKGGERGESLALGRKLIAVKVRDELKEVSKNLKKRSLEATKRKMGKLGKVSNKKKSREFSLSLSPPPPPQ